MRRARGFTLVELVITLLLTVIVAGVASQVIGRPLEAYDQLSHRARLVDSADAALGRIAHEVRGALPNSLRIGCGGECVEFLATRSGGRYRAAGPGDPLDFNPANSDTGFAVIGPLPNAGELRTGSASGDCLANRADCLVIYNTGQAGNNAWRGDNAATLTAVSTSPGAAIGFHNAGFSGGQTAFPTPSPGQRFHISGGPVAFLCDTAGGTLRRYSGHPLRAAQTEVDSHAELMAFSGTRSALLGHGISECEFRYAPGNATRSGLLSLRLRLGERLSSGHQEHVTLLVQAHVSNIP